MVLLTLYFILISTSGTKTTVDAFAPIPFKQQQLSPSLVRMSNTEADNGSLVLSYRQYLMGNDEDKNSSSNPTANIQLILASQSPRRREILDMMGLVGKYQHEPSPLDESALQVKLQNEKNHPIEYTRILAEEKAKALAEQIMKESSSETTSTPTTTYLILGSDTIVDFQDQILEKPTDEQDAQQMLQQLSGNQHYVHTGVALYQVSTTTNSEKEIKLISSFTDTATVTFATLTKNDIKMYITTQEPMDKAGSYGIQGIGGQIVSKVDGDFFTVMGLPMHLTSTLLAKAISSQLL